MNEKPSKWKVFTAGIIRENPVLRLVLGCCSALAVTTTVSGATYSTNAVYNAVNAAIDCYNNEIKGVQ